MAPGFWGPYKDSVFPLYNSILRRLIVKIPLNGELRIDNGNVSCLDVWEELRECQGHEAAKGAWKSEAAAEGRN